MTHERYWPDIGYLAVVTVWPHSLAAKVYGVMAEGDPPWLCAVDALGAVVPTTSAAEATPYVEGRISADHCSDWRFGGGYETHFCGRGEAVNLGTLLGRLYDLAADLIPDWQAID